MATILISASDIQEHLDSHGMNITSVSWNEFNGPEVEYSINEDMEFEDDDLIDKDEIDQLQRKFDELEQDHTSLLTMYDELVVEHKVWLVKYDTLEADYNRFKEMMARKRFSLKFWK